MLTQTGPTQRTALQLSGGVGGYVVGGFDIQDVYRIEDALAFIPPSIRQGIEVWVNRGTGLERRRVSISVGRPYGSPTIHDRMRSMSWLAGTAAPGWIGVVIGDRMSLVPTAANPAVDTVLHEYGHIVDSNYHRTIEPTAQGRSLTQLEPWLGWFAAARPTIPNYLYGWTDIREWFAELWTAQLLPGYRGQSAGHDRLFRALAGEPDIPLGTTAPRANAIRAEFVRLLPDMPPFGEYGNASGLGFAALGTTSLGGAA